MEATLLTLHPHRPSARETVRRYRAPAAIWLAAVILGAIFAPTIGRAAASLYLILWILAGGQ
jgi:hypothetical protein